MKREPEFDPNALRNLRWQLLEGDMVHAAHHLHVAAVRDMGKSLVRQDDLALFLQHEAQGGKILGCLNADGKLVAYGVIGIGSPTSAKLAHLLGLDEAQQARFAILDGAAVLPGWRGRGLHLACVRLRLEHAAACDRTLLGVTVAPGNLPSLRTLLKNGFEIRTSALLYGGMPRLAMLRDTTLPPRNWRLERKVGAANFEAHQLALAAGLTGFASSSDGRRLNVHYGLPAK